MKSIYIICFTAFSSQIALSKLKKWIFKQIPNFHNCLLVKKQRDLQKLARTFRKNLQKKTKQKRNKRKRGIKIKTKISDNFNST